MLKQPRSQDICRHFGENTSFLLVLFAIRIIIFFTRTFSTAYTRITRITCNEKIEIVKKVERIFLCIVCRCVIAL